MSDYRTRLLTALRKELSRQKLEAPEDQPKLEGYLSLSDLTDAIINFGITEAYRKIIGTPAPDYLTIEQLKEEITTAAADQNAKAFRLKTSELTDRLLLAEGLLAEAIQTEPKIADVTFCKRVSTFLEMGGFSSGD